MSRAPYLFPVGCQLGTDNLVLRARARHHRVEGFAGPWSIKTVVSGEVAWIINGRQLVVDPCSFLIVPGGTKYSMNIEVDKPVETCCVFFASGFVEQVASDLTSPLERALEMQAGPAPELSWSCLSTLHNDGDRSTVRRLQSLARRCADALTPSGFEEEFVDLAMDLLRLYERIREQMARLPAVRSSTREELFRRLLIGREYFHSHATGPLSLATVARAAGLSLFHFHRGFTRAFQQTPHSYLTRLRLAQARRMMETGSSVLDACIDVGFSSPSSFSRLFRSYYGEPPSKLARSGKNSN